MSLPATVTNIYYIWSELQVVVEVYVPAVLLLLLIRR